MLNKAILSFLACIFSYSPFAQQADLRELQMSCVESKLTGSGGVFELVITNNTTDTFLIPDKIFPGVINSGLNFGYEVQYIDECNGDTTDLTKYIWQDIHYADAIPWQPGSNLYTLLPGEQRTIKQYASEMEKKGNYLVRFTMKKVYLHRNGINSHATLKSGWIKVYKAKDNPPRGSKAYLNSQPVSGISVQ